MLIIKDYIAPGKKRTSEKVLKEIKSLTHEDLMKSLIIARLLGYEDFDNRRALLTQINSNEQNFTTLTRLKKMKDNPFFGSVEFLYDGDDEAETFYIGIGNFAERTGSIPLVYDWRAPVSGLFYDFDKGVASYEAPGGTINLTERIKEDYNKKDGSLTYHLN